MAEPDPNAENKRRMEALLHAKKQGHADRAATDHVGEKTKRNAPSKKEFRRRKV